MMNELIIIVAKHFIALSVVLAIIAILRAKTNKRKLQFLAFVVVTGVISFAISRYMSHVISDPRPFVVGHFKPLIPHGNDNGFPSDHVLLASALAWSALFFSRRYGIALLVLAALIGAARVLAGVHHAEDIIGSFVISGIGTLLAAGLLHYLWPHKKDMVTTEPAHE